MVDPERRLRLRVTLFRTLLVLAMIAFVYGSVAPSAPGPKWGPGAVLTHFVVSLGLGLLCRLGSARGRFAFWGIALTAAGIAAAEAVQLLIPAREASLLDVAANLSGLAAGYLLGRAADARLRAVGA
ncbi:MAG: hypothetical protein WD341_01975 [Tistlia sp.]|uniref:hypothetical protein n=1 Tax=Tistlia sp. TaxID=3057121 RepID=UPI0034A2B17A